MKKKIVLVTGCSGFIGSHLVELLIKKKKYVVGLDNLSTGRKKFIDNFSKKYFKFHKVDLLKANLDKYFNNVSEVYHLSANADVRYGTKFRSRDLEQNVIVTHKILEQSIKNKVKKFIFSSSGSVYGEAEQIPTKENCPFPLQTSLYGASKLSAEALISAYAEAFNLKTYIFRFVSILGPRYSHGHVYDFIKKLNQNPKKLNVLGDGNQKKSYLHVSDCVTGIFKSVNSFKKRVNIINLGTNEYITVKKSIKIILNKLGLNPKLYYSGGKRGWVGDNPFIFLDTSKIRSTGWKPNFSIEKSVVDTVEYIIKNKWILKKN